MAMQIKRRFGAGAPTAGQLESGQLGYHKDASADLYVGNNTGGVDLLVGPTRQVEVAGDQLIAGEKTFTLTSFRLGGGNNGDILALQNATNGTVHWTPSPSGGLLAVATDATLQGNGADVPLSVVRLPAARTIGLQGGGTAPGPVTTITATGASFDGSANVTISAISIGIDDGTY